MQAIVAVIFTGIAAIIGFTLYVVEGWMPPTQPLIVGLVAICPALIGLAFAVSPALRSDDRGMGLMMAVVMVSVVIGMVPGAWSLPEVRTGLLEAVAEGPALKKALDDEDAGVQLAACGKMLRMDVEVDEVFSLLNTDPEMATRCMESAPGYAQGEELVRRLANQWHQVMMMSADEAVCMQTEAMGKLDIKRDVKGAMLLGCALGAGHEGTRACCVEKLESKLGKGMVMWTRIEPSVDALYSLQVEDELLAASFGLRTTVTPEQVKTLDLKADTIRRNALERVCTSVLDESATSETLEVLKYTLSEHEECLTEEVQNTVPSLAKVCMRLVEDLGSVEDIDGLMCQAQLDTAVRELQVYLAKLQSVDKETRARMGTNIGEGWKADRNKKSDLDSFANYVANNRKGGDLRNYTKADFVRMQGEVSKQMDQLKYETWAQGGAGENMTAGFGEMQDAQAKIDGSAEGAAQMEALREEMPDYDDKMAKANDAVEEFNKMMSKRQR